VLPAAGLAVGLVAQPRSSGPWRLEDATGCLVATPRTLLASFSLASSYRLDNLVSLTRLSFKSLFCQQNPFGVCQRAPTIIDTAQGRSLAHCPAFKYLENSITTFANRDLNTLLLHPRGTIGNIFPSPLGSSTVSEPFFPIERMLNHRLQIIELRFPSQPHKLITVRDNRGGVSGSTRGFANFKISSGHFPHGIKDFSH
jgi:hypothetical protein